MSASTHVIYAAESIRAAVTELVSASAALRVEPGQGLELWARLIEHLTISLIEHEAAASRVADDLARKGQ